MKIFLIIITFIFFCFSSLAEEIKCPDFIETKQELSTENKSGWQSVDDTMNGSKNLKNMSVYDGNPKNVGSSLAPDNKGSKDDPYWTNKSSNALWVSCVYEQTTIRLVKSVPSHFKKCTLKYKSFPSNKMKRIVDRLVCK